MKEFYKPPHPKVWSGRSDGPNAPRIHENISCYDLTNAHAADALKGATVIVGFCSDEGIRRNQGRQGAVEGPRALRQALGKIPLHSAANTRLCDVGDIACIGGDLEGAQQALADVVSRLLALGCLPIVLGGGHEVAWGHYLGIAHTYPKDRIGIINFDAHFDLRPLLEGNQSTSGTSFLQIAEHRQQLGHRFDYLCLGVQRLSNTSALYQTANQLGVAYISAETMQQEGRGRVLAQIDQLLSSSDRVYVSICMDVFAAAFAPGVSAPQPLGLLPKDILPLLIYLANSHKVVGIDIAEVSPPLDHDGLTAALGAMLIAQWINAK